MDLPDKVYTETDIDRARRHGKLVGWVQGGAAVVAAGLVFELIGWVPTILVVGGVGYLAYRVLLKPRTRPRPNPDDPMT